MKVVKDGNVGNLKDWKTNVTCQADDEHDKNTGCGAVLEITVKDLFLRYFKGSHFNHYYTAVTCPRCGKKNRVKNVPQLITDKIHTSKNKAGAEWDGFCG